MTTGNEIAGKIWDGERARRGFEKSPRAAEYERFVSGLTAEDLLPSSEVASRIDECLEALVEWAGTKMSRRLPEEAETLLDGLEQLLSVGAVLCRRGWMDREELLAVAGLAAEEVRGLAPHMCEVWEIADDRTLMSLDDPELPGLYAFWEEAARFAPSRLALGSALGATGRLR